MVEKGDKFDIIFIDADKENYVEYYELSMKLLAKDGIILADNSLCALLYDQGSDVRSTKLHEFNQHVKNDKRTEQVVLTVREGVTLIVDRTHNLRIRSPTRYPLRHQATGYQYIHCIIYLTYKASFHFGL